MFTFRLSDQNFNCLDTKEENKEHMLWLLYPIFDIEQFNHIISPPFPRYPSDSYELIGYKMNAAVAALLNSVSLLHL